MILQMVQDFSEIVPRVCTLMIFIKSAIWHVFADPVTYCIYIYLTMHESFIIEIEWFNCNRNCLVTIALL